MNNVSTLAQKPVIQKSGKFLQVSFLQFSELESGYIKLFSPSDPKKDKIYSLASSAESTQLFSIDGVAKGMYRARMQWVMNGKEYYVETVINI